jgi:hypothetical protein
MILLFHNPRRDWLISVTSQIGPAAGQGVAVFQKPSLVVRRRSFLAKPDGEGVLIDLIGVAEGMSVLSCQRAPISGLGSTPNACSSPILSSPLITCPCCSSSTCCRRKKPPAIHSYLTCLLAATTCTPRNEGIRDFLAENRRSTLAALQQRLERGMAEGDLPAGTDTATLAAFYTTVFQGLSIRARDGATRELLEGIITCAMAAWDALVVRHATPSPE